MEPLIPGQKYFLKWITVKPNGKIHNMVILEGEFIKYYNNSYYEKYKDFINDIEPNQELIQTIINQDEQIIEYPFDNPLYPYCEWDKLSNNFGLFKIISVIKTVFKGNFNSPWRGNNPYNFVTLQHNTIINNTNKKINYGETLMWVNLDKVQIRPKINKLKLLQEKAIETIKLPDDMKKEMKIFF